VSFLIAVNGIPRQDVVRYRTLQIRKDGAIESARMDFLDNDGTLQVVDGDVLRITQDGALEFGGVVVSVRVSRVDKANPLARSLTVTTVDAQGWAFEAADITATASFPSQGMLATAEALRATYLAAKGWTNNGALSGGPVLPALTFTRQTVAAIFDELQKLSGWPWRVNGDRVMNFSAAGSIPAPVDLTSLTGSVVLTGVSWQRSRLRKATRLESTTGGSGTIPWTDSRAALGGEVMFPLYVYPTDERLPTKVDEGNTTHNIGGGRWTYRHEDATLHVAGAPVAAGVSVSTIFDVDLPATVRVFDPVTRYANGTWNFATVIDAQLQQSEQTDIRQALASASAELNTRIDNPRGVELSTFAQGFYPWQTALVSFPERGLSGPYLVQSTLLTDVGRRNTRPRIDVTLLEGNAIGRDWTRYFKERSGTTGGGGTVVASGGGNPPSTGGAAALPAGTTFRIGGDNVTVYSVDPTFRDCPQLSPTWIGGAGMSGTWILWVPAYQLTPGVLEFRLLNQATQTALATLTTTAVGERLVGPFAYLETTFTPPADSPVPVLLQWRTSAGTRQAVMGHANVRKT
jgi:hypothetical protein